MTDDKRDLLAVLKGELEFLEKGGYRSSRWADWRPHFIFQDSPTCLNTDPAQPQRPCSDCLLMQLVPEDSRNEKIPCRYIPLNERGDTLDSMYRTGTKTEIESVFARWLKTTIARLARERAEGMKSSKHSEIHMRAKSAAGR